MGVSNKAVGVSQRGIGFVGLLLKAAPWLVAFALLLGATSAQAMVTTPYDPRNCFSVDSTTDSLLFRSDRQADPTGILGNYTSPNPMTVICPLTRTTAGPGVMDDSLDGVTIPVFGPDNNVYCEVQFWSSEVGIDQTGAPILNSFGASGDYNRLANPTGNSVEAGYSDFVDNWDYPGPSRNWLYQTLECTLNPGTAIYQYQVRENGTDHGYRIYSAASCKPDSTNNMHIVYDGGATQPGGIVRGQAATGYTKLAMDCPMPANSTVDFSVGNSPAIYPIGCNLDQPNLSTLQWRVVTDPQQRVWPSQTLPYSNNPFIAIPSTGQHQLVCGINGASGDGKLLSYRSAPPKRAGWTASASASANGQGPANAISPPGTRWSTGAPGTNQWFIVNFGARRTWSQVTMDSGTSTNDYARGYRIDWSQDGRTWTTATTGTGTGPFIAKKLTSSINSQYVRISLTSTLPNGSWWSLYQLNVY